MKTRYFMVRAGGSRIGATFHVHAADFEAACKAVRQTPSYHWIRDLMNRPAFELLASGFSGCAPGVRLIRRWGPATA